LRNLDTSDDDDDDDSNDDEGSSSDDDNPIVPGNATTTVPTTPKTTGRRFARVQFVDINNFVEQQVRIVFAIFLAFTNIRRSNSVIMNLNVFMIQGLEI
jgi:hypothetical protein